MRLPKNSFHPGEVLREEFLVLAKITQAVMAQKLGWMQARLSKLIEEKRDITVDAALYLAQALGTSASSG